MPNPLPAGTGLQPDLMVVLETVPTAPPRVPVLSLALPVATVNKGDGMLGLPLRDASMWMDASLAGLGWVLLRTANRLDGPPPSLRSPPQGLSGKAAEVKLPGQVTVPAVYRQASSR